MVFKLSKHLAFWNDIIVKNCPKYSSKISKIPYISLIFNLAFLSEWFILYFFPESMW